MTEERACLLCINKQTKERRLLPEQEALDLDYRLWDKKVWSCNSGGDKEGINKLTTPPVQAPSFAPVGVKCLQCGSYHPIRDDEKCVRGQHIKFANLGDDLDR